MATDLVETLALRLDQAARTRVPIPPFSETEGLADTGVAYQIQSRWTELRTARGEKVMGRKIGLTSEAIQKQLGVDQPDYGNLWNTTGYTPQAGRVEISASDFVQPRLEGEVAFLIGKTLQGPGVTTEQVLAATDACALGVEIVASRIADWRIKLVDTVADNASYGGYTIGPWDRELVKQDLGALKMSITQNGALAAEGVGAAALGHPAKSVAWLANTLSELGIALHPGDIVISGGLTKMLPVKAGDRFVLTLTSQPPLTVTFVD